MRENQTYSRRLPNRMALRRLAGGTVLMVVGALLTSPAPATAAPLNSRLQASSSTLQASYSSSRSAPFPLNGSTIVADAAIYAPAISSTESVAFYLDGGTQPMRIETSVPFDLAGTTTGGDARMVSVSGIGIGPHILKAVRMFDDGEKASTVTASFVVGAPTPAGTPARLVTVCGVGLCMDGAPWRLNGGSTNGNPDNGQTSQGNLALALALGVNTVRLTDFISRPGPIGVHEYQESQWVGVDQMIALAAVNHLKVELDLSTYRNFLESQSHTFNPYTYDWTKFLTFVANRRNTVTGSRYGSDTTIAFVSFAGETEAPDHSYSKARGVTAGQLISFYDKVMTLWGKLAPGQIRIPGGLYFLTDPTMPWRQIYSLPSCDLPAIHSYSTSDERSQPAVSQLARQLGKPWIVEEFGFSAKDFPKDTARAADFARQYDLALTNGAAGVAWWNIDPAAVDAGSFPLTVAAIKAKNAGPAARR